MYLRIWLVVAFSFFAPAAYAADPGDSCASAQTGYVQTDGGSIIICNGTTWNLAFQLSNMAGRVLFQVDNDAGSCTAAKTGRLRYDGSGTPPWQYCSGSAWLPFDRAPAALGYLVQTTTKWNGNLGGLSGANAKCLTELQTTYNWNGKSSVGTLTAARVYALLCDGASCNNLKPNTIYQLAKANSTTACGWAIISDSSGQGPNSQTYWDETCYDSNSDEWMNRGTVSAAVWAETPKGAAHCSNWGSTSGNGAIGNAGNANAQRWDDGNSSCNTGNFLVCAVDPL